MSPERQREFARRGGIAAHRAGTAHEFTVEEARAAGRKGGLAAHRRHESGVPESPTAEDAGKATHDGAADSPKSSVRDGGP